MDEEKPSAERTAFPETYDDVLKPEVLDVAPAFLEAVFEDGLDADALLGVVGVVEWRLLLLLPSAAAGAVAFQHLNQ